MINKYGNLIVAISFFIGAICMFISNTHNTAIFTGIFGILGMAYLVIFVTNKKNNTKKP